MRLIDADEMIKGLSKFITCKLGEIKAVDIKKFINKQPTVEPNQWIPCSERLPEENSHYLVTYHHKSYGNYLPLFDDTYVRKMRFQNEKWMLPRILDEKAQADEFQEVIAWMPLPQAYTGKESD
jgi:hypothetical protein